MVHPLELSSSYEVLLTDQGLDFLGLIKLVNYVRSEVQAQRSINSAAIEPASFADDKYLLPVLEDDAVLFSLGDLVEDDADENTSESTALAGASNSENATVSELEAKLARAQEMIAELRMTSARILDEADAAPATTGQQANRKEKALAEQRENDSLYFKSYAYNDIHEIMLKDTVRTDAYRDFIYENKDVFAGKTVLDVGCGTGILSMMCAKAGAKKVFAVDNSDIINKARANVFENELQDVVTCLHGKIEEINLPVPHVDIIVSEWMGYALLYESMLDSVIHARDKYLVKGGLMVPSHTTLFTAPIEVPDIVSDRIGFWQDVYGFKMPAMLEGVYEEVLLRNLTQADVVGQPSAFLELPLHTCSVADTVFKGHKFNTTLTKEVETLDGFAVWFDMFFARTADEQMDPGVQAKDWKKGISFSTGPGKSTAQKDTTHWMQAVLLINRLKEKSKFEKLGNGSRIDGSIGYERRKENDRQLDIDMQWQASGQDGKQKWDLA